MSYTINPNAKNGWVRNAENTMDLSIETDASSVYLDNGRTLEQELGEGSMVSSVATVDNSMSKVIDGTLDGAYESCVFKGKSLVNLITHYDISLTSASKIETGFKFNAMVQDFDHKIGILDVAKPNTYYTYIFTSDTAFEYYTGWDATNGESWNYPTHQAVVGLNILRVKTEANTTKTSLLIRTTGNRVGNKDVNLTNFMLLEGDHTNQDVSYFEGLCDVKMPILRNVGKNLFNKDKLESGDFDSLGNPTLAPLRCRTSNFIPVESGSRITLSKSTSEWFKVFGYDSNKQFVCVVMDRNSTGESFNIPSNVHFIKVKFDYPMKIGQTDNIQIEYNTKTTYEDYKTNILRTSEEIVLREVNGVQDTYNPLTGEYVQRIGEIILDGSESWAVDKNYEAESHICYKTIIPNINNGDGVFNVLCDKFPTQTGSNLWSKDLLGISGSNANASGKGIKLSVRKSDLNSLTTDGLKEFLSQNPTTVQYQLESPIVAKVDLSAVPFAYENGHVILESGHEGQSLLSTLEYSTVINRVGQIQSIANTIQKQEKQITKLEQMLIQNIIDLDYNNTLLTLKNEMEEML